MANRLLLVALDGVGFGDYRQGFVGERFFMDMAYKEQHALGMLAMRRYRAIVIEAQSVKSIQRFLKALSLESSIRPSVVYCIANLTCDEEVALLQIGATACRERAIGFNELLAHIRALLRRRSGYPRHHRIADLGIDPIGRRASRSGVPLPLRPIEFELLLRLAEGNGRPVSKEELADRLWPNGCGSDNLLAVHMRNLRRVVETDRRCRLLHTVRQRGYALCEIAPNPC